MWRSRPAATLDKFWKIFDERLELCYKRPDVPPQPPQGHALGRSADPLAVRRAARGSKKGEPIDKLLYGGYSTISLGYAGLYECVQVHDRKVSHRPGGHAVCA